MKIALVCPDGLTVMVFCKGIIRALQSISGARVIVVCDAGAYRHEIEALGVTCAVIAMYRWIDPIGDLKYAWKLWRFFRHERCDVVLNFATKPNIYGSIAAKLAGTPLIMSHVVGLGAGFHPRKNLVGRALQYLVINLYRLACVSSNKVWFTNANNRKLFIEKNLVTEAKTLLTRNYLDVSEYDLDRVSAERMASARRDCGIGPKDQMVIMVARMIWSKGIREFAEAAELLRRSHPALKFVLVAPLEIGSHEAVPESFIREKERGGNLIWLGFQNDVKRLYAIADLAVLPTYYKEGGYPRALLEPMAMGKPVITTDSEDCRGTVEEGYNGYLVPQRDARALADAIARVMSDEDARKRLGRNSQIKAARDFDEKKIVPGALRSLGLPVAQ
jgi:glycosyltransferase involved in cell wall biosynthesis